MAVIDNLVSYFKLDEASGTATDAHSTNHLADVNTVTSAAGKLGTARQFTAASLEYLAIADNAALSTGDIDFTLAAWVYLDSKSDERPIVSKWDVGGQLEYMLFYNNATDRFSFALSSTGSNASIVAGNNLGSPALATWYYVVVWHDSVANTQNLQVNNGTVDSIAYSAGVRDGTAPFEIGRNKGAPKYMDGRIDAPGFWKRVVSAGDRTSLYNTGAGLEYPFTTPSLAIPSFRTPRVLRQRF